MAILYLEAEPCSTIPTTVHLLYKHSSVAPLPLHPRTSLAMTISAVAGRTSFDIVWRLFRNNIRFRWVPMHSHSIRVSVFGASFSGDASGNLVPMWLSKSGLGQQSIFTIFSVSPQRSSGEDSDSLRCMVLSARPASRRRSIPLPFGPKLQLAEPALGSEYISISKLHPNS